MPTEPPLTQEIELDCEESWFILSLGPNQTYMKRWHICLIWLKTQYESWLLTVQLYFVCHLRFCETDRNPRCVRLPMGMYVTNDVSREGQGRGQSLERESNRSDSKMRARHLLSCLTDGEILILLSSQSVELVHGMLSTHFCILLPKSNWSLLLSCSPAGLSLPARGCSVFPITAPPYRSSGFEERFRFNCT